MPDLSPDRAKCFARGASCAGGPRGAGRSCIVLQLHSLHKTLFVNWANVPRN